MRPTPNVQKHIFGVNPYPLRGRVAIFLAPQPDCPICQTDAGGRATKMPIPRRGWERGHTGNRGGPGQPRGRSRDLPAPEAPAAEVSLWGSTKISGKMGVEIEVASSYLESALTIQWSRDQPSWKLISGWKLAEFRRTEASLARGVAVESREHLPSQSGGK